MHLFMNKYPNCIRCDVCGEHGGREPRFVCLACYYDLCAACALKIKFANGSKSGWTVKGEIER